MTDERDPSARMTGGGDDDGVVAPVVVTVDGEPVEPEDLRPLTNLADLVAVIEHHLAEDDRVLVQCLRDGEDITDLGADQLQQMPMTGRVEMTSARPADLVVEGAKDALTLLPEAQKVAATAAKAFRVGQLQEGLQVLGEVVGTLEWLAKITTHLPTGFPALTGTSLADRHAKAKDALLGLVNEMVEAQTAQDWVALADALEYGLPAVIGDLLGLLAELQGAPQ